MDDQMFDAKLMDIATKLKTHCENRTEAEGLKSLYARDAVSVEAASPPGMPSAQMKGVEAIQGKHDWWFGAHTVHSAGVEGPFLHGKDRFGLIFSMNVTEKESKRRMQMKELGLYEVKDGKIVREEFYYAAM